MVLMQQQVKWNTHVSFYKEKLLNGLIAVINFIAAGHWELTVKGREKCRGKVSFKSF
jgi:hypothetical protein